MTNKWNMPTSAFARKSIIRQCGSLVFVFAGISGMFLLNSMLIYDRLSHIDDEYLAKGPNKWNVIASSNKHLAALEPRSHFIDHTFHSSSYGNIMDKQKLRSHRSANDDNSVLTLRKRFEHTYPSTDINRIRSVINSLRNGDFEKHQRPDLPYEIHNCPETPPQGYPMAWSALDVLVHWGVDNTDDVPKTPLYQGLCVFDWDSEQKKAETYRRKQLPFVVKNHPGVMETAERFSSPNYLNKLLGDTPQRNEHGKSNHLMFWRTLSPLQQKQTNETLPPGWTPPTNTEDLTFAQWLAKAQALETSLNDQTQEEHWYFRINAYRQMNNFLYEEMPYFDPEKHDEYSALNHPNAFLMVDAKQHRGINCRFGMKGVIAEMHFDSTLNFVVLLGGQRRYILAHPDQCKALDLYDRFHPSGRHSKINFSNPSESARTGEDNEKPLSSAMVNEVVLQAGDTLYLPTNWFHFIVSLNTNYQCNSRSGATDETNHFLDECDMGF